MLTPCRPIIELSYSASFFTFLQHVLYIVEIEVSKYLPKYCGPRITIGLCVLMFGYNVQAKDGYLKISLGGYLVDRFDTTMSLTDESAGLGVAIDPAKTLDLETEQSVFRLEGVYQFNDVHAFTFSWYRISSEGEVSLKEEIDWIDENGEPITIPVGAEVNTTLDYDIYKVGYLWSYYHTDKVELTAGAGLHVTKINIDLVSDVTSSGISAKAVDTSIPLPVVSVGLSYNITPNLFWFFNAEAFALAFDEWDGVYTDTKLGIEYTPFSMVGFGLGVGTNSLLVNEETRDYRLKFENRITGLMLYVSGYF